MDISELNKVCLHRSYQYNAIDVAGKKVKAPYFINNIQEYFGNLLRKSDIHEEKIKIVMQNYANREIPYGWYRGKGTPEELSYAILEISRTIDFDLTKSSSENITELMKLFGIGIDCSGFVYNLLNYALTEYQFDLDSILCWTDMNKRGVYRAGTFAFAGDSSNIVNLANIRPLDLILIKSSKKDTYRHIGIILKENENLIIAQSSLNFPTGVSHTKLEIVDTPIFEYIPDFGDSWEDLYKKSLLEFRRLKLPI